MVELKNNKKDRMVLNQKCQSFSNGWVFLILILTGLFFTQKVAAQCTANNFLYPNSTINGGTGALVSITTQQYEGDYSQINGIVSGARYKFTINVASDIITVRVGSRTGLF